MVIHISNDIKSVDIVLELCICPSLSNLVYMDEPLLRGRMVLRPRLKK
jgi:hypothetical protein